MKAAAIIRQFIKDQPANDMKTTADKLLGTHLQSAAVQTGCRMDSSKEEYAEQPEVNQKEAVGALRPTIEPVSKRPFYPNMVRKHNHGSGITSPRDLQT